MQIVCFNCKYTWEVPAGAMLAARLKFGLGLREHTFPCPDCGTRNVVTEEEYRGFGNLEPQVPLTGAHPREAAERQSYQPKTGITGKPAPTNPVEGPGPESRPRQGVVLAKSLDLYREHSIHAEVMDNLKDGERITILAAWTNGEETWVQLGPERWAPIEWDGDALIELAEE